MVVRVEDTFRGELLEIETDMVVLSEAMEPSEGTLKVADILNVGLTEDMFVKEKHPKINRLAPTWRVSMSVELHRDLKISQTVFPRQTQQPQRFQR